MCPVQLPYTLVVQKKCWQGESGKSVIKGIAVNMLDCIIFHSYVSRSGCPPETFHYKPGAGQVFSQPTVMWSPCNVQQPQIQVQTSINTSGQWTTRIADNSPGTENDIIPVVIVCEAEEGDGVYAYFNFQLL